MSDTVNHPAYYVDGNIEVIDFIDDKNLGFCLGNAVKYIARAGKKDPNKTIEDLRKAVWYINHEIEKLEKSPCPYNGECELHKTGSCAIPIYNGTVFKQCFELHGKGGNA